ncbi:hypothetical protein K461DRAFT_326956 [Myriangium duriaei CBS 260.36]|uniref:Metallo-beta-lactamase domain-containing protein n=1 Tax=Myriangium duriaei CBS 260.36 TaxID=1168546 RepID=A0A9P4JA56_9PEZI|nr:hypothetical protein K461DRAFT_326956 [Myriangium duriaei CBS 260.36]
MSTFDGFVSEFPLIRIDQFATLANRPPPLVCLLSHVHTDHLRGLETFKSPFVYCTHATRQLLLRMEKYPHRLNFARGVLESRKQTYRHLKKILRPLPLGTPTHIELRPGETIKVTALDANHCPGACMFMIQGNGRNVLYTGDLRCEAWFVDRLIREPVMHPFVNGLKTLDRIYLDTTYATRKAPYGKFPTKADGVKELLTKISLLGPDTILYFDTWTFGYEEVWIALSNYLDTNIHVDEYRWRLYRSLADGEGQDILLSAPLVGFQEGHRWQSGCLAKEHGKNVRIHSCERGMGCEVFENHKVVLITPIVTRYDGIEYDEKCAGGGQGDLNQIHELELTDLSALGRLMELCTTRLQDRPEVSQKLKAWLADSIKQGAQNIKLDTEVFQEAIYGGNEFDELDDIPIDRLVAALDKMGSKSEGGDTSSAERITFPYSRHASFQELRLLVGALRPNAVFPNTYEPGMDMDAFTGVAGHVGWLPESRFSMRARR